MTHIGPPTVGPINRSIKEERRVQVLVRDNNVDQALKVLKKKMQREGIFREMKLRGHYEKPSEKRVREKAEAHPPRPQARAQEIAARGPAADEASGDPRGPGKRRPRARPPLLISEPPIENPPSSAWWDSWGNEVSNDISPAAV